MTRSDQEAWHEYFLPRLSTKQINELDKETGLVVLPIGAVEQHGPHLPVYTDTLIASGLLGATCNHLTAEQNIWMLPPLPYGKSTEHLGHPGTMTLSATSLQQVVLDIGRSVSTSGFRRLVLFNTHGGNNDLLNMMARELRIETGLMVFRMNGMDHKSELAHLYTDEELAYGIHGGDVETSIILALEEKWVHMEEAPNEFYDHETIDVKGSPYVAWIADDISDSGISGNAQVATKEKGEETIDLLSEKIARQLEMMSTFEMNRLKKKVVRSPRLF
ncbi:creatininase family protein [Halalkalibacter kiskunsagensis]|uniref:Creatininase family protein n=1 Tax=Halalkalibacter kiskunsagensis TaxID=1548599 RepID=A0ABV6K9A5_9BACI